MQFLSPGPPSPAIVNWPGSPQKSFFGGSLFTSPLEEVGDPLTEGRIRRGWWGEERDPSMPRGTSRTWKSEEEKQCSDKEKSKERSAKEKKENSKGESQDEKVKVKSGGSKEEVQGPADHPEPGKDEKDDTEAEEAGKIEVVYNGPPPIGEDKRGEVRTADQQLKAETAKKTEDDATCSFGGAKSLRSLDLSKPTNQNQGSTDSRKKLWSLMITRRSTPEQIPATSRKLTEDVAGPRFETVKEPEGERCAGDYPPIYTDGFVSPIPSPKIYVS